METKEWTKWCRLCGKNNGSDVDATLKIKNTETLAENIRKYFGILISESDICTKICNECNNTINSIVKYNSQVLKVNGMFLELEQSYLNENLNLSSLRKKHGLNNNINGLKDSEMHETDFRLVKADVKSKSLSNSPPPVDVNSYLVIEYSDISFKSEPEDSSTAKPTEIDEATEPPNENSSVVFPFGLNDLDEVNFRCRYCNMKFHKTDSLIKHTENHFNYILTCNICKKHFSTKQNTQRHKTTHLTNVKSKPLNNSTPPVDLKSCKIIEYNDISFKSNTEDNSTTKQTEIYESFKHINENSSVAFPFGLNDLDEVNLRCKYCNMKFYKKDSLIKHTEHHFNYILTCNICKKHFQNNQRAQYHKTTHLTNVKSKILNNSPPPLCLIESEIRDVSDVNLENSVSFFESNDVLPSECVNEDKMQQRTNIKPGENDNLNNFPPPLCLIETEIRDVSDVNLENSVSIFESNDVLPSECVNEDKMQQQTNIKQGENENLNSFPPPLCLIKTEIRDVSDIKLENSVSSFESNDVLPNECVNEDKMQQQTNIKQGGDNNISLNQAETPTGEEKLFDCNICQKRFTFRGKTKHMRKHFANKDIVENPFPLQCRVCGKSWKNLRKLRSHEAIHLPKNKHKSYECSYCKKKYKTKQWLNYHVSFVHKKDRSFMCEFCGEAFPTNMNLRYHMLIHSKEKKFKCSKCEKTFKRKVTLKVHMDSHEGTEYPCQICGLKLNTRRILGAHMIVHSNENKYKCNICSKQYKRSEQFKLHLMSHLKLKPFECFICNLTFASQTHCRKHQRIKHPVELAAADLTDKPKTAKNVPSMKYLHEFNEKALRK